MISAHWETESPVVSAVARNDTIHDFHGFPRPLYEITYPAPGAPSLAIQVAELVRASGLSCGIDKVRGLDHGAWVPLLLMYPEADIPVLQLSIPTQDPAALLSLGARLRPLRESGVLIIGSGFLTHGLPFITMEMITGGVVPGWSSEFDAWAASALASGDVETLARFKQAPGMPYAHPTADHFLPLFVTLGAATDPSKPAETIIDGYWMGFAKRSIQVS